MQKNSTKKNTKKLQFSLKAPDAKKVSLVGVFNNWFWVDGEWMQDPDNLRACPNCFGTQNSVAKVILN